MLHDRPWDHNWTKAIQHLPALEQLIEREPVIVSPQTSLYAAIGQMNQSLEFSQVMRDDQGTIIETEQGDTSSCILVTEDTQLVGILTERDMHKFYPYDYHRLTVRVKNYCSYWKVQPKRLLL
jgi:CBS domain-containing protein